MIRCLRAIPILIVVTTISEALLAQPVPISTRTVAPGVIHREYTLSGPFTLDVLEVSLRNPYIELESYKPDGLTRTSVQSEANDGDGHRVVGAVNADFFSFETEWPVGNQVVNGKVVLGVWSARSHLAIDEDQHPFIERLSFSGAVRTKTGALQSVASVNSDRTAGSLVFFTSFRGASTGTDGTGMECAVEVIDSPLVACDTLRAKILTKSAGGNSSIPVNGGVLSAAGGAGQAFLNDQLAVGDTISLYLGFGSNLKRITQVLGGAGRILLGGRYVADSMATVEQIGSSFVTARHPRTFVGFNSDTTKFYLCTVDGRQTSSVGMSFSEMANFLTSIGVSDAFNFDGGGSTTMIVRGEVVNSPSDPAGERSVANSLQVISTAPLGTLHYLEMQPEQATVFQRNTVQFSAEGTDEYYNPIPLPPDAVWEAEPQIGTISATGLFTALSVNDSGWVRLRWNSVVDSSFVVVRQLVKLRVNPPVLVMIPGEQIALLVRAEDSDGRRFTLPNAQASFSSLGSSMNVNAEGIATATDFGSGTLSVILDTLRVDVPFFSTASDTSVLLDGFDDLFGWTPVVQSSDTSLIHVMLGDQLPGSDGNALKVDFSVPLEPAGVALECEHPISGRPDSIFVRVYGAGNNDTLRLYLKDKDGQEFVIDATSLVSWANEWRTVGFRLNRAVGAGTLDYPVQVARLGITIGDAAASSGFVTGTLGVDALQAHYPLRIVSPQVLFDFEGGIGGWLTPPQSNAAQLKGINIAASTLVASTEKAYQGSKSGKWTFVDDAGSSVDWDVRMPRYPTELGSMLRGSYVGAWVYAEGQTDLELRIVIRDGNGLLCSGPSFPVNHIGWKLIGTKLEPNLFTSYLTAGQITETDNKFNGFRLLAPNSKVSGKTKVLYIDKLVTNALTVPTGFVSFTVGWNAPLARLHWVVNSEISISRYVVERSTGGAYVEVAGAQAIGNADSTLEYEVVDTPPAGETYLYRIRQITNDGAQEVSPILQLNTATGAVTGVKGSSAREFRLNQNFPNPFNPATTIHFSIPTRSFVHLAVYDLVGRQVATLVDEVKEPGDYPVQWKPDLPSGVYLYRVECRSDQKGILFARTGKMVLVK